MYLYIIGEEDMMEVEEVNPVYTPLLPDPQAHMCPHKHLDPLNGECYAVTILFINCLCA